ncbi:putative membrane protein [Bacillus cereus]|nr:putative membrane protein [Bacillus cereus]
MIPFCGFAFGTVTPFILKLFGTKVVPFGMESVNTMLFAVVFPVFVIDEVNVIVSPIVAKVVLAFLFKTKVASIIGVTVVFVIVLSTAGDWFGFTVYS